MSTMKKHTAIILLAIVSHLLVISCSNDSSNDSVITEPRIVRIDENYENINDPLEIMTGLTAEIVYPVSTLVGLKFVYPYVDPKGKPVMLSGIICIPKTLYKQQDKKAQGIMLYNHYTIATADYYGFGETNKAVQYYCEGNYNAHASLEALKAAKNLLTQLGYSWDDYLLNVGYSQGGQTAIAVQKLVDSGEYNEKISATYAGSGPYDLTATYHSYIDAKDEVRDLSVVVYPFLSFNTYKSLGISYSETLNPTLAENIENWFFSKNFGLGGIYWIIDILFEVKLQFKTDES